MSLTRRELLTHTQLEDTMFEPKYIVIDAWGDTHEEDALPMQELVEQLVLRTTGKTLAHLLEAVEVAQALGGAYDIGQKASTDSAVGRYRKWKEAG